MIPTIKQFLTGSSVICPGPDNNDIDIVCLVDCDMASVFDQLHSLDQVFGEAGQDRISTSYDDQYVPDRMLCARIGEYNYIYTDDPEFFRRWGIATRTAVELGPDAMREKAARIALFKAILYAGDES